MTLAPLHKYIPAFLLLLIASIIVFKTSLNSSLFQQPYDPVKMQRIFDYSQWRNPHSKQGISDEQLYQIAGYHILKTGEMYEIAPEVPPLGKYFYGYSIILFTNAYYAAFALFLIAASIFYVFTKLFIKSVAWRLFAVLLFISDPLLSIQAYQTMMDIPHLIALLIHMYAIVLIGEQKKRYPIGMILLAGISLGAFAGLKIGFFTVLVLFADFIYLWPNKKFLILIPVCLLCGLIYPVLYLPYFLDNHNLIDFLKTQKWVLNFYLISKARSLPGMPFISLFTGFIKGWDGRGWDRVKEWSWLWPILGFSYFYQTFSQIKSKNIMKHRPQLYLIAMIAVLFAGYLMVPFFARYFTLTLPLLIICFILLLQRFVLNFKKAV